MTEDVVRNPPVERSRPAIRGAAADALRRAADFLFVLPALALLTVLMLYPAGTAVFRSFYDWEPGLTSHFIGLSNYRFLANSILFHWVLRNEAVFLIGVPIWVALPVIVSCLLYRGVPFAGVYRSIFFFPSVLSPAIVGILFRSILGPDGLINKLLGGIGLSSLEHQWIDDPALVKPVLIAVLAWAGMGTGVVIFSAGLSSVPPEQFEAAEIDGASFWQQLRFIMLPSIAPLIVFYAVLQLLAVFLSLFTWIYVLTRGGPGFSSTTIDWDIYINSLTYARFGLAAAEAVYLLGIVVVILALSTGARKLQQRAAAA